MCRLKELMEHKKTLNALYQYHIYNDDLRLNKEMYELTLYYIQKEIARNNMKIKNMKIYIQSNNDW